MSDAQRIADAQAILVRDIGPQRKCELLSEVLGPLHATPAPAAVEAPPEPAKPSAKAKRAAAKPDDAKAEGAEAEIAKAPEGE